MCHSMYLYESISSLALKLVLDVIMMTYWCWAEDCISLIALAKLAQLILTERVCYAIL